MNLFHETYRFARWAVGVTRRFFRVRPWSTAAVTIASATNGVLHLLAFLVPLKVILLAASPGVPSYFPFIDPAHKVPWVIGLAFAAVGAYLLGLLLDTLSDRWSRSAGRDVLRVANDIAVHGAEEDQIQKAFIDFTSVIAALIFLIAAGIVLALTNPVLTGYLGIMTLALAGISSTVLANSQQPQPRFKAWIVEKTGQYLGFWRVVTFFGALGVIVYPFLTGLGGNIFLAIIGFIVLRQMLGSITSAIAKASGLVRRRSAIDALIYRSQQVVDSGGEDRFHTFRALFGPDQREPLIAEALQPVLGDNVSVRTAYVDPVPASIKRFDVVADSDTGDSLHFDARVFPQNCTDQVANADFLFRHIPRARLGAPRLHSTFTYHDYTVVIQEAGSGKPCHPGKDWAPIQATLIRQMLSVIPPVKLVRSYCDTRRTLPERLARPFCERLWLGVDSTQEAQQLKAFLAQLESVRDELRRQPLALCNPEISPPNVIDDPDAPLVMAWGKWTLEPIGVAMGRHGWAGPKAEDHLDMLKLERPELSDRVWSGDLALGAVCHQLEQAVAGERYKAALGLIISILAPKAMTQ